MRYLDVAEQIRAGIATGAFVAGGPLPSEADLGRRFGVSRVTVRKALDRLRDEGVVTSRQGAGWFVAVDPVRQTLGRFRTVEAALEAAGVEPRREVFGFGFVAAPADVAAALHLADHAEVLEVRRVTRAGGEPFGLVTVWVSADLGRDLSRADVERATLYDLLPLRGVEPVRATQTVTAVAADNDEARLLGVRAGAPLLALRRVTRTATGDPVLVSDHRYPGHRTSFEIEFGVQPDAAEPYPSRRRLRAVGETHG